MSQAVVARVIGWDETRLAKAEGRGESQQLPEAAWAEAYASGQVVEPPYDLDALAGLYETNATHKACVDAKTTNIVGLGYRFVAADRPALKYRSGGKRPSGTPEDGRENGNDDGSGKGERQSDARFSSTEGPGKSVNGNGISGGNRGGNGNDAASANNLSRPVLLPETADGLVEEGNKAGDGERRPTPGPSLKGGGNGERPPTRSLSRRPQTVCERGEENNGRDDEGLAVLEGLFGSCNPDMTFTEVMRAVWTDVECLGNGYIELTRNSLGQIDGFYHVPGTSVRVLADRSGFLQIREGRKRYFRALGQPEVVDPDTGLVANEMMHFTKYTPQSTSYGVPDIIPAVPAVVGDKAAREYNIDFFTHNAVPRMAIIVEGGQLSDAVLGQLKQFMESEIKGQGHKTLVLETPGPEARVRLEKLTVGAADEAGFLEYRKANRNEVLLVHRVPPSKVTVVENANLANSKDQDKTFREQVVRPEQRRIEYRMNRLIREQLGVSGWEFRFREMDLDEEREQAEVAAIYAGIGVLSPEEIRSKLGA